MTEHSQFGPDKTTPSDVEALLPTRYLTLRSSSAKGAGNELAVDCPMEKLEVILQRCAFCRHGRGLLLETSTRSLTLRCSFSEVASADGA